MKNICSLCSKQFDTPAQVVSHFLSEHPPVLHRMILKKRDK
jgi:hypothetical protein